jgi:hypothetical protein
MNRAHGPNRWIAWLVSSRHWVSLVVAATALAAG